ncbi:GNAT family N-acetyltransferase [Patescibacteria group bacterium]|nr:GNAT family N-acetyltransferase [Patescibacteria group bacterium]MBU1472827.1 GNAT family N-acetyltransferase [Patescibacteria group bacterium]MBU2460365.1 GNAT family N-acetyltransferase [Patescibacteria group bacterium]MBU2543883.1 GNAT family N-acetyltransferase [Patescibacteria group bacterium]
MIEIQNTTKKDVAWIQDLFNRHWGGKIIVAKGIIHKPEEVEGMRALIGGKVMGAITYKARERELEIISLNSFEEGKGVGSALLSGIIQLAKEKKLQKVCVITTNDNLNALRFYQKRGFRLTYIYPNALVQSRKLKPGIPLVGENGIPLRDEIELEIKVC